MLLSLRIENFALIDRLELEFGAGLNVLTGETGAGKSIILDALDTVLGGKVSARSIRTGAERAAIAATFTLDDGDVAWWVANGIEPDNHNNTITCLRELTVSSRGCRSKYRINGATATQKQVQAWRDRAVEIAAQGQTVQLGQATQQRELLDLYGGAVTIDRRQEVARSWSECQHAKQALERRQKSERERLQQLDLLTYQLEELRTAELSDPQELDRLQQEAQRLANVVDLQQQSYQAYRALYQNEEGGSAAADLLGRAEAILTDMGRYDDRLQPILELVGSALVQAIEAGQQINAYGEALESDPQRLAEVEERIRQLKQICRKYGPTLAEAIDRYQTLQAQLEGLDGKGQSLEALEAAYREALDRLQTQCDRLTHLRQKAARQLESRLVEALQPLAMEKVQFQVEIAPTPPSSTGADRIAFLFSANPGEPLKPLSETASGGEMSRFLLALKTCFSEVDAVDTLVFDEIDVGVSGRVAQAIADNLHQLSAGHQVLCVTHQPIVAAMADRHFRVDKLIIDTNGQSDLISERTIVRVTPLNPQQRREELAQLAGGQSAREAIAFADSLLARADSRRQVIKG
ncbi:MAG TPA: DNA repair protein RecN [Oscillatoriales cyanobacterium M59_W2019_021]|nr:DNA repair protein RecN [Oscillatoriales cyanobacterium M59_W2019_021]